MRVVLLVSLVMVAFAGNSVLNRLALAEGLIGALPFAGIRVGSGAAVLCLLVWMRGQRLSWRGHARWIGALCLSLYMMGFSAAYLEIDAGAGALLLFGGVQVTMFLGAMLGGQSIPVARWAGAGLAFGGVCWLLWPTGDVALSPLHAGLMLAAALGWGIYSLVGQRSDAPLADTAANFALAVPICAVLAMASGEPNVPATGVGVGLACLSGVVTSGLGYALWYAVLPRLAPSSAAISQLSVPLLAMAGGAAVLGEALSLRFGMAAALVLGGVALGTLWPSRTQAQGVSGSRRTR